MSKHKISERYGETMMRWFDLMLEGIIIIDGELVVEYVNNSFLEYANLRRDEIIGHVWTEERAGSIVPTVLREKKARYNIHRFFGDGVESYGDVLPTLDGDEVIGALIVVRDIKVLKTLFNRIYEKDTHIRQLDQRLKAMYQADITFEEVIGDGEPYLETAKRAAGTDGPILLVGESGTGKEVIAQAVHSASPRGRQPFVDVNCAALPENLLESELFGYAPGAFTGASRNGKIGLFELANGGTIFLDEITEMPLAMQSKLLRVLQEQKIRRLGDNKNIRLDVRVIAATNRDVTRAVEAGALREDLFYRLAVIVIQIPPLRERPAVIPKFISFFISTYEEANKTRVRIEPEARDILLAYNWPGNVRQLKNALEYSCMFSLDGEITAATLPQYLVVNRQVKGAGAAGPWQGPEETLRQSLDRVERKVLSDALKRYGYGLEAKEKIAERLGISIATLYNKLRRHGMNQ